MATEDARQHKHLPPPEKIRRNAFCLSNIIAATAVIGLQVPEGMIVKRVLKPVCAQFIICTLVLLPFIYA
eukprot:s6153_g3.t1